MDTATAARLLGVAEHEVLEVRQHAEGGWEALHEDMASHVQQWRRLAPEMLAGWWENPHSALTADAVPQAAQVTTDEHAALIAAAETAQPADAAAEAVDDDPDGPGVDVDGDGVPDGSAKQILDWVGADVDKAKAALAAEQAKEKPRATLVAALEKLAG